MLDCWSTDKGSTCLERSKCATSAFLGLRLVRTAAGVPVRKSLPQIPQDDDFGFVSAKAGATHRMAQTAGWAGDGATQHDRLPTISWGPEGTPRRASELPSFHLTNVKKGFRHVRRHRTTAGRRSENAERFHAELVVLFWWEPKSSLPSLQVFLASTGHACA